MGGWLCLPREPPHYLPVEAGPAIDPRKVLETLLAELPLKQAVALAVKLTGGKRNELYDLALQMKK